MSVITLITDFGTVDEYVGAMKGVILSIHPDSQIVDISHQVSSQDIYQAAFLIQSSFSFFPAGTVHLIVVDPGVGSNRSIIALKKEDHFFVAPDNGILSLIMASGGWDQVVKVNNPKYFLDKISHTFHGRDIMAPVSAHLSKGLDFELLGPPVNPDRLVTLDIKKAVVDKDGGISGCIISIDKFGNLVTNIHKSMFASVINEKKENNIEVKIGNKKINGIVDSYNKVDKLSPLSIIGSRDLLEVAVNCGNASDFFSVNRLDPVFVKFLPK